VIRCRHLPSCLQSTRYNEALDLLSHRETLCGILSRSESLRAKVHISRQDALLSEVRAVLQSGAHSRKHGLKQRSLISASYLSTLVPTCEDQNIHIGAAAQLELATTLWDQDEIVSSTKMLQTLSSSKDLARQSVHVGRSGILAQLVCYSIVTCCSVADHANRAIKLR